MTVAASPDGAAARAVSGSRSIRPTPSRATLGGVLAAMPPARGATSTAPRATCSSASRSSPADGSRRARRRQGREERGRLRPAQALRRLVRHARRHRGGDGQAAPACPTQERLVAVRFDRLKDAGAAVRALTGRRPHPDRARASRRRAAPARGLALPPRRRAGARRRRSTASPSRCSGRCAELATLARARSADAALDRRCRRRPGRGSRALARGAFAERRRGDALQRAADAWSPRRWSRARGVARAARAGERLDGPRRRRRRHRRAARRAGRRRRRRRGRARRVARDGPRRRRPRRRSSGRRSP